MRSSWPRHSWTRRGLCERAIVRRDGRPSVRPPAMASTPCATSSSSSPNRCGHDHAGEKAILRYLRCHWTIEALHHARDVSYVADGFPIRSRHGAQAMVAVRHLGSGSSRGWCRAVRRAASASDDGDPNAVEDDRCLKADGRASHAGVGCIVHPGAGGCCRRGPEVPGRPRACPIRARPGQSRCDRFATYSRHPAPPVL